MSTFAHSQRVCCHFSFFLSVLAQMKQMFYAPLLETNGSHQSQEIIVTATIALLKSSNKSAVLTVCIHYCKCCYSYIICICICIYIHICTCSKPPCVVSDSGIGGLVVMYSKWTCVLKVAGLNPTAIRFNWGALIMPLLPRHSAWASFHFHFKYKKPFIQKYHYNYFSDKIMN